MLGQFDFNVIERSLGYLFREGMTFTLTLTALAVTGGIIFGTLCLFLLVAVVSRERHYRKHGYPRHGHHHGRCGGCGYHHHDGPHSPPVPPQSGATQTEAAL